jgi:hypothetical protein
MCATSSDAEEAIPQTFLSAYGDLGSLQTNGRFRTWLCGIALAAQDVGSRSLGTLAPAQSARRAGSSDQRAGE